MSALWLSCIEQNTFGIGAVSIGEMVMGIKMYKKAAMSCTPRIQRFQRQGDSWRRGKTTAAQRGYDYRWQKLRKSFLQQNPLCVFCAKQGVITVANVVDHIVPHRGCRELFLNWDNLQSLCAHCHNTTKQKMERQGGIQKVKKT